MVFAKYPPGKKTFFKSKTMAFSESVSPDDSQKNVSGKAGGDEGMPVLQRLREVW
jgi:hypothetical protein